jgi:hypothetical protein
MKLGGIGLEFLDLGGFEGLVGDINCTCAEGIIEISGVCRINLQINPIILGFFSPILLKLLIATNRY